MNKKATIGKFALSKYVYVLIFMVGAVAFLYPLVTNYLSYQAQTRVITSYHEEVALRDQQTADRLKEEAKRYNEFIAGLEGNVTDAITEAELATTEVVYMTTMSTGEAIGTVSIPKIEVELPIYRGTSDAVLNRGVGHIERSSLPIGGQSTHSVLSGHRGLPTAHMFRDLGLLKKGDIFLIDSIEGTLAYEVERIQTVLPTEVESLQIQEGRDLCTLITCDPYMINSHRMLVTGTRVEYTPELAAAAESEKISFFQKYWEYFAIVGFFVLLWLVVLLIRRRVKKYYRNSEIGNKDFR